MASAPALAQPKTDVATLANGDRITGEVKALERGRLEFSTDDAGTLYLEWEHLLRIVGSMHIVEVVTTDGRRFVGTLTAAPDRSIAVTGSACTVRRALITADHVHGFVGSSGWWRTVRRVVDPMRTLVVVV